MCPASGSSDYESMTVVQLKELCKSRGLIQTGNKAELVQRLKAGKPQGTKANVAANHGNDYESMTVVQLKELCKSRGLIQTGNKAELVQRLKAGKPQGPNASVAANHGQDRRYADDKGRTYAETIASNVETIAKGYSGRGNVLEVVKGGRMAGDPRESAANRARQLRASVPDRPGNYMWLIRPPNGRIWTPVYCGKAGGENCKATLNSRFKSYINDLFFGPVDEPKKLWVMVDLMSRGFSIEIRFRLNLSDAVASEDKTLSKFNFPCNKANNGAMREIMVATGSSFKKVSDYPVKDSQLQQFAQNTLYELSLRNMKVYG